MDVYIRMLNLGYGALVNLLHILFVAPLFFCIWWIQKIKKKRLPNKLFLLIFILAIGVFSYHGYKLYSLFQIQNTFY